MYIRKTRDVWAIQGCYEGGWEDVTEEITRKEALTNLKLYREADPKIQFRLVKRREKIQK